MSDDPETARQIAELSLDTRPLLVLDVDDVILEFIGPFMRYLDAEGHELAMKTFRLHGNIVNRATGEPADNETVAAFIAAFFDGQANWQTVAEGAAPTISDIAGEAEIVLLTAMPHRFRETRRAHLDALGLTYPMVTTEAPKGPALKALRGASLRPVAFVDDIPHNHKSVLEAVPDANCFHLMSMPELRGLLPPLPDGVAVVETWTDAGPKIKAALGLGRVS
jgi:hypothetical protein